MPQGMVRPIRWRAIFVACALAVVLLAGCGGGHSSTPPTSRPWTPPTTSVVMIEVPGARTPGTGWVYSAPDGLVMTSFHVTNGASEVRVKVERSPWRRAAVVAASPCEDVALLAVNDTSGLRTTPLGTSSRLATGTPVTVAGFTADGGRRRWQSRRGAVADPRIGLGAQLRGVAYPALDDVLETKPVVSRGQAGGPVTDNAGRLVAMGFATFTTPRGARHGLAISVDRLLETIDAFDRGEAAGWVSDGVYFYSRAVRSRPRGVVATGLPGGVDGKYPGGGVLVKAVDGVSVGSTFTSWCRTIGALPAGWAKLTIVRRPGGTPEEITIPVNRSHVREYRAAAAARADFPDRRSLA
jgi:S1-C subfamily serine protease